MKEGQQAIYYVDGRHATRRAANSPHLEFFRKKGIEVLILYDRIDEWVAGTVTEFEGKPLRSVAKGALDLGELADAEEKKAQEEEAAGAEAAGRAIEDGARRQGEGSARHAPAHRFAGVPRRRRGRALGQPRAAAEGGGAEGADDRADPRDQSEARAGQAPRRRTATRSSRDWANLLFDEAMLAEGAQLPDPAAFVRRLNALVFGA